MVVSAAGASVGALPAVPALGCLPAIRNVHAQGGSSGSKHAVIASKGTSSYSLWTCRLSLAALSTASLSITWRKSRQRSRRLAYVARAASCKTWEELQQEVEVLDAGQKLTTLQAQRDQGIAPHTDAKVRYFNEKRGPPRVTLYRDDAAWCPYCQKVWLLLEEKQVDYEVSKVNMRSYGDKPQKFLRKVRGGLLPAIEIDGVMMTESLDIMFAIDQTFPDSEKPMLPPPGPLRERAVKLLELERAVFGAWCQFLFRPEMPFLSNNKSDFEAALQQVNDELGSNAESNWFLQYSHPTIVDMQYVSHMERMVASALYWKGFNIRERYQNIDSWLQAFERLPYYMATKSDYYTHCTDIPPQYGTPYPDDTPSARRVRSMLDPANARMPVSWDSDPEIRTEEQQNVEEVDYCIEAAWSIVKNHKAVVRFCCRPAGEGVGMWADGNPTKSELADPYAIPGESMIDVVDIVLRVVTSALVNNKPSLVKEVRKVVMSESGAEGVNWKTAASCIEYLRARIGVPRDMQMPSAKLLRAYLGDTIVALRA